MRPVLLASGCVLLLTLCALLARHFSNPSVSAPGATARAADAGSDRGTVKVQVKLVNAKTSKSMAGLIRVFPQGKKQAVELTGLFPRMHGLGRAYRNVGWYVVPASGARLTLPTGQFRLEALSGLETALAQCDLDLRERKASEITVPLQYLFQPQEEGLVAGNTHLHLRGNSLKQADEYLRQIPPADRLRVVFLSYLERNKDDRLYISNRYPVGELKRFRGTGVLFSNGEEHRHNFEAYGQGYGHVMLLNLHKLVRPVSLGPGITGKGNDDRPLRPGIDEARKQGGTIIWCHNTNGHEDVPSVLTGRLDALNVFDGSRTGRFEDNYYRYLNIGIRLPISTGTDWFLYDFARVYVRSSGKLSVPAWLKGLAQGRNVITNGPMLTLQARVKGDATKKLHQVGSVVKLTSPTTLELSFSGVGRQPFGVLELIHNGKVMRTTRAKRMGAGYHASMKHTIRVSGPAWFAVRINTSTRNEMQRPLFAHTSPLYVDYQGKRPLDLESARALLRQLEEGQDQIKKRGQFSNPHARKDVLALYEDATRNLHRRVRERGGLRERQ